MNTFSNLDSTTFPFDARGIAKRFRHAAIFGAIDALQAGEAMRFVNDHDPLPLLAQIGQRYGSKVDIEYIAREPGNIVIDFSVLPRRSAAAPDAGASCGGGGHGCGCGGR